MSVYSVEVFHAANRERLLRCRRPSSSSGRGSGDGGLLVLEHRQDKSSDSDNCTGQFAHLIGGRKTFGDEKSASGSETMTDERREIGILLFRLDQMSRTFLMMTLSAASEPNVTLI